MKFSVFVGPYKSNLYFYQINTRFLTVFILFHEAS